MKIDMYTKAVLTVIAGCLLVLCVKPLWEPKSVAAQAYTRVVIEGLDPASQQLQRGLPVNVYGTGTSTPLPVSVVGSAGNIPVNVAAVGGQAVGKEGVPTTPAK
jgi:hypothetical protein